MDSPSRQFGPVSASSLSTLTRLASDPPLQPRDASRSGHAPLVLYLARVPGRRDVFLTPMKPRSKTVTAADVESCLYYLHFNDPKDEEVLAEESLSASGAQSALHGRPLPPIPDDNHDAPVKPFRRNPLKRKPVHSLATTELNSEAQPPLPPRHKHNIIQSSQETKAPPLPPRHTRNTVQTSQDAETVTPSITLVRRDPSSGAQWNIASIRDPPVLEVSSTTNRQSASKYIKATGAPLYLDIYNQGYNKFCSDPTSDRSTPSSQGRVTPEITPSLQQAMNSSPSSVSTSDLGLFRRRLWLEGSHFSSSRANNVAAIEYAPNKLIQRSDFVLEDHGDSSTGWSSPTTLPLHTEGRLKTRDERRSAVKGYTFLSPWNGRCEFGTSTFGSALKCRHRLPGVVEIAQVSELRFNLPSQSKHKKSLSQSSLAVPNSTPSSTWSRGRKSLSASHIDTDDLWNDDQGGFDLSLGQELAGGGVTGKRAKLGKLIIEDEGLKMMDLLTAANMALWWRVYEHLS